MELSWEEVENPRKVGKKAERTQQRQQVTGMRTIVMTWEVA